MTEIKKLKKTKVDEIDHCAECVGGCVLNAVCEACGYFTCSVLKRRQVNISENPKIAAFSPGAPSSASCKKTKSH